MPFVKHYYGEQMKEDEITGACSTHLERSAHKTPVKTEGTRRLSGRGDWRKTLKCVLKKYDVDWIHLAQEMYPGDGRTLIGKKYLFWCNKSTSLAFISSCKRSVQ